VAVGHDAPLAGAGGEGIYIGRAESDEQDGVFLHLPVCKVDSLVAVLQTDVVVWVGEAAVVHPRVPHALALYGPGGIDFAVVQGMGEGQGDRVGVIEGAEGVADNVMPRCLEFESNVVGKAGAEGNKRGTVADAEGCGADGDGGVE